MAKSKKNQQWKRVRLPSNKQIERIVENSVENEPKERVRKLNDQQKLEN